MSENENKLKKIHDSRLISSLILNAKEKSDQVIVWKFIGNKKITANVKITVVNKVNGTISFTAQESDNELLKKILASSETLNFYIPNGSTLFQSKIRHVESLQRVNVYLPQFVAQLERRKWIRLKTDNFKNVRIQFSKKIDPLRNTHQFYRKNVFDLGVGGMALIVTKLESKFFLPGELVKGVELLIDDTKIVVDLEVANLLEIKPGTIDDQHYRVWKVGFKFAGMQKKDSEFISSFVFKNIGNSIAV